MVSLPAFFDRKWELHPATSAEWTPCVVRIYDIGNGIATSAKWAPCIGHRTLCLERDGKQGIGLLSLPM